MMSTFSSSYQEKSYSITVGSRLHIQVIDPRAEFGYLRGGLGAALSAPKVLATITPYSVEMSQKEYELCCSIQNDLEMCGINPKPFSIKINNKIPEHIGLGSGSIHNIVGRLLAGRFHNLDNDCISTNLLNKISLTAVSVYSVINGGMVLVGGHQEDKSTSPDLFPKLPPLLTNIAIPKSWKCVLCTPNSAEISGPSGKDEIAFYGSLPSPSKSDIERCSNEILSSLLPSVYYNNYSKFCSSMNIISKSNWKQYEANRNHEFTKATTEALINAGALFVGVTSCGPTIYTILDDSIFDLLLFQDIVQKSTTNICNIIIADFCNAPVKILEI